MSKHKVALVSGGNRGIGLAIVQGLAQKGMTVLLGCRDVEEGALAAKELTGDIQVVSLHLTTKQSMEESIRLISEQYPKIDVLVNNAAILDESQATRLSYNKLLESMHINALAPFALGQYFGLKMKLNGPSGQFFRDKQVISW